MNSRTDVWNLIALQFRVAAESAGQHLHGATRTLKVSGSRETVDEVDFHNFDCWMVPRQPDKSRRRIPSTSVNMRSMLNICSKGRLRIKKNSFPGHAVLCWARYSSSLLLQGGFWAKEIYYFDPQDHRSRGKAGTQANQTYYCGCFDTVSSLVAPADIGYLFVNLIPIRIICHHRSRGDCPKFLLSNLPAHSFQIQFSGLVPVLHDRRWYNAVI